MLPIVVARRIASSDRDRGGIVQANAKFSADQVMQGRR
jgi:hypothetical protein